MSYTPCIKHEPQKTKFNFQILKDGATSSDPQVRKSIFIEYFERFQEFPSYLFDNSNGVDALLSQTIRDLKDDPEITEGMRKGIAALIARLPEQEAPGIA